MLQNAISIIHKNFWHDFEHYFNPYRKTLTLLLIFCKYFSASNFISLRACIFLSFFPKQIFVCFCFRSVVSRKPGFHSLGYVFTAHPVEIGKTILMTVEETDHYCEELFVYGITSCDPSKIEPYELPDTVDDLLDRPEYWVVKQKSYPYIKGDTIRVTIGNQGNCLDFSTMLYFH